MKTLTLILLLAGAGFAGHAQQPGIIVPVRTEEYCQLRAFQKLNSKVILSIDYGQQQALLTRNLFRDEQGQAIEFKSVIDALNWLNAQGWELVNAYAAGKDTNISYYIMRRRIRS